MKLRSASILFYTYIYGLCQVLRWTINGLVSERRVLLLGFLTEVLAVIQVCAPILDVDFILDEYGLWGVFLEIFVLEWLNWKLLEDGIGHPCFVLSEEFLENSEKDSVNVLSLCSGQVVGAWLSFPLTKLFWSLGLHPMHDQALAHLDSCQSDLTVSVSSGFLIECVAMFLCRYSELYTEDAAPSTMAESNSFLNALLTIFGIHLTGMYCNPLMASVCTWNCDGVSLVGHVITYWSSAYLGWFLAERVFYCEIRKSSLLIPQILRNVVV